MYTFSGDGIYMVVLAVSPDGNHVAYSDPDFSLGQLQNHKKVDLPVEIWNTAIGDELVFSPDSQTVIGSNESGRLYIYNIASMKLTKLKAHTGIGSLGFDPKTQSNVDMVFTPDGGILISGGRDGWLYFWRTSDWEMVNAIDFNHPISNLAISKDGGTLAIGDVEDNHVEIWNLSSLTKHISLNHPTAVNAIAFSPDGSVLATACSNNLIYLWDAHSGGFLAELKGHVSPVKEITFSMDGKLLASMGDEATVRLWGILPSSDPTEFAKISTSIASFLLTPTSTRMPNPTKTASPTSIIPNNTYQFPMNFPLPPITTEQMEEVRACNLEIITQERYPEALSITKLEHQYIPQTACDWAALSAVYLDRLKNYDPIPEQGKRAFIQAILLNPAFLFSKNLFYGYYDSFNLVDPIPISEKEINAVHIDYQWSGIGGPSDVSYQIDINKSDSDSQSLNVSAISPSGRITTPLETTIDREFIENLLPSLTNFVPIEQQFSLNYCYDNSPDWQVTISFTDGSHIDLQTNGSSMPDIGGPWQTMIDGQNYLQYSFALPRFMIALFEHLGLHLPEWLAWSCFGIPILDLAYPQH